MNAALAITSPQPVKLTVADYLLLDRAGAFERYGKTELIDGQVFALSPQYRKHGFVKAELAFRLRLALEALGSDLYVATEGSVDMSGHDMPQPDITLTREPRGEGAIPLSSVDLIVEIADTSLRFDLDRKAPLYARNGVAEYWVADVNGCVIHQMWKVENGTYAKPRKVRFGQRIASETIASLAILTDAL